MNGIVLFLGIVLCVVFIGMTIHEYMGYRKEISYQRGQNLYIAADAMRNLGDEEKAEEYEQRANKLMGRN